jgi:hydrogenase maturation protein HypF
VSAPASRSPSPSLRSGRRILVQGAVQGVGFRPFAYHLARSLGVTGRVINDSGGVSIEAFGEPAALSAFTAKLEYSLPSPARVDHVEWTDIPVEPPDGFSIDASAVSSSRRLSIPADIAVCEACLAEVLDPSDRRHLYPFTNCTHCGPRFTIVRSIPYDRTATSMVEFAMCDACQAEYDDPDDRRFHAQPNACPECGPSLALLDGRGRPIPSRRRSGCDAIVRAQATLRAGGIVAIKGIGGFHLAVDATSDVAVQRLRLRKARDEKPFAVMVPDLDAAIRLAHLNGSERNLLGGPERPIVLALRKEPSPLSQEVAPSSPLVGVLLAYTPLHQLLLADLECPLVMTSANASDEQIIYRDRDAVRVLSHLADRTLTHDRAIVTPCEDSVARVIGQTPTLLRRGRGYSPCPLRSPRHFARPVLACGGQLKNTICLGVDDALYLGPHVGDLDTESGCQAFEEGVSWLERLVGIAPEIIAHDLHPDYFTTRYALARTDATPVGVQHHHAHIISALWDRASRGPVLGVAYDGTGLGTDGTAWGSELLIADSEGFERLATFEPLALPGGDHAIRDVWRIALAFLDAAFDGAPDLDSLKLFDGIPLREREVVRRMIQTGVNTPLARGMGRYFDAFGAIGLSRPHASYEGQLAAEWSAVADPSERGRYEYTVDRAEQPWTIGLRPALRAAVKDLVVGVPSSTVSARFHETLLSATAAIVHTAAREHGHLPVVLSGGCFQNPRLSEGLQELLASEFEVIVHGQVPPGDGGISVGQAIIADALARRS